MDGGDGHLGRVVDHHPLDGGDHDVARLLLGLLARLALDGARESHGIVLGLVADLLEQDLLGLVLRHLADPLEGRDLLLARLASSSFA